MSMRRRGFLGLFGAAVATPLMPMGASAGASATYSRAAFRAAVAHAQKFPVISVVGLSKRGGLSMPQAEAMIKELASKDMVKLVGPSRSGRVRAASKILKNDPWGIARTSQERHIARSNANKKELEQKAKDVRDRKLNQTRKMNVDLDPLLAHLRQLCLRQDMTLSPRCYHMAGYL